jgi:hypothetical protein
LHGYGVHLLFVVQELFDLRQAIRVVEQSGDFPQQGLILFLNQVTNKFRQQMSVEDEKLSKSHIGCRVVEEGTHGLVACERCLQPFRHFSLFGALKSGSQKKFFRAFETFAADVSKELQDGRYILRIDEIAGFHAIGNQLQDSQALEDQLMLRGNRIDPAHGKLPNLWERLAPV